ncbi:MAG: protein kinase, partial [Dokdonella sp.]
VVYKGHESSLNRYVAIKVLADSLAHDEGVKERFLREARSMASLNDPHIIQIYYIGDDEGQTYFVMEFVEGESLGTLLKREHKVAVGPAAKIIYQTALGLATAHDKGVIHRDIKPGNLMVSSRGSIKIADFGIALSSQDLSKKLTSTGEFVGTPGYLSPEVCLGRVVDQRSDIFSLGIVLFEMLAGRMPFTDESPLGLMLEVVRAEIPDVRELNKEVDEQIAWILSKMIAKEPDDRYQSCHELAEDLANHPLVSRGGPIMIVPKVSAAAATLIGQKTPFSGQRPLSSVPVTPVAPMANTRITPSAQPMPPSFHGNAPATAPGIGGASTLEHRDSAADPARKSSALPIAIAAILVLGLVGGAWAFRDKIPGLSGSAGERVAANSASSTTTAASVAAVNATTKNDTTVSASTPTASDNTAAATQPASTSPDSGVESAREATRMAEALIANPAGSNPPASNDALADGPGPRASQADVDALRDLPAARAAQADSPQIAVATPPK